MKRDLVRAITDEIDEKVDTLFDRLCVVEAIPATPRQRSEFSNAFRTFPFELEALASQKGSYLKECATPADALINRTLHLQQKPLGIYFS